MFLHSRLNQLDFHCITSSNECGITHAACNRHPRSRNRFHAKRSNRNFCEFIRFRCIRFAQSTASIQYLQPSIHLGGVYLNGFQLRNRLNVTINWNWKLHDLWIWIKLWSIYKFAINIYVFRLLSSRFAGRPRPNVTWYLDNTVIDESFEHREGVTRNHLTFPNIGRQHVNARFVCMASNTNLVPPNNKVLILDVNCK